MVRRFAPVSLVLLALALATGCGPVTSTIWLNDAEVAVESARLEGAEEYATYEFVSAVEYLAKAKEEWGYSDWQHAEEYAARALAFGRAARERAMANPERNLRGRGGRGSRDDDF
jgi:hypothetical protein